MTDNEQRLREAADTMARCLERLLDGDRNVDLLSAVTEYHEAKDALVHPTPAATETREESLEKDMEEAFAYMDGRTDKLTRFTSTTYPAPEDTEGEEAIRHHAGGWVRPSVVRFARLMESQLRRNDSRGGWANCDRAYFMEKLEINLRDLGYDLRAGEKEAVQRDCADLGNFAMMLAENEYLAARNASSKES